MSSLGKSKDQLLVYKCSSSFLHQYFYCSLSCSNGPQNIHPLFLVDAHPFIAFLHASQLYTCMSPGISQDTYPIKALMKVDALPLNAIFCGVSSDEFHRISHITIAKEAWQILETTYEGTKKVKDTKLQMLTTRFKELKMSEDESFDSFYSKLNEVVISKFNLGEKMEDSKIVRKILRSLRERFHAKVTAIEESKNLDDIKVQELIGSLQTYELSLPSQTKSKSLALKTINERVKAHDSSDEDAVNKDVVYLVKNFQKFLKFKNSGKFAKKGKFPSFAKDKKDFKKREGKESLST